MFKKSCANVQFQLPETQPPNYGIHDRIEGTIIFTPQHAMAPGQVSLSLEGIHFPRVLTGGLL